MGALSMSHWLIVMVVILLVFGTKKLGGMGKSLAEGLKGFRDGLEGSDDDSDEPASTRRALPNKTSEISKKALNRADLPSKSIPDGRLPGLLGFFAHIQSRFNGALLFLVLLGSVLLLPTALTLGLKSEFSALLPADARSVRDRATLVRSLGVSSTLTLAVQHPDRQIALDATEHLLSLLERKAPVAVTRIEGGKDGFREFVESQKALYLDLDVLKNVYRDVELRFAADEAKRSPFSLGLEDDLQAPTWKQIESEVRSAYEAKKGELSSRERGLFAHPTLPLALIFIRASIDGGALEKSDAIVQWAQRAVSDMNHDSRFKQVRVDFGGDLMDSSYETRSLAKQMILASLLTLALVLASVYLFFRSLRSLPLLALVLVPPVLATFAFAACTVEYLNTSTAFLMSIVIGNGINPSIIWLSRFYEELRRGTAAEAAVHATHSATFKPTLAASLAAALAYGSLALTEFRGFRDFGIVGGVGMLLCWTSAIAFLPLIALRLERRRPLRINTERRNPYGALFAWLALQRPKLVLTIAGALSIVALLLSVHFLANGPMEYDFRRLISVRPAGNRIQWVNDRQREVVSPTQAGNAIALLAPTRAEVHNIVVSLEKLRAEHPTVLGPTRSIDSFLPTHQDEKLPILIDLRRILERAKRFASPEQTHRIEEFLPAAHPKAVEISDLPQGVTRMFTESNGTVGRLIFSEQATGVDRWDARNWARWTSLVRSVQSSSHNPIASTGTPMIFSDVVESVIRDAPRAFLAAGLATLSLVLISLRGRNARLGVLVSLFVGLLWMLGGMSLLGLKLQFLNLLAFPVAVGNGVDYAVNLVQRFNSESSAGRTAKDSAVIAVGQTGGAVALCALTTIIGYLSIHISDNRALRSFAAAMALAEMTCVLAALVALPAWLSLRVPRAGAHVVPIDSLNEDNISA